MNTKELFLKLIKQASELGASDIHIAPNNFLDIRLDKGITPQSDLFPDRLENIITKEFKEAAISLLQPEMQNRVLEQIKTTGHTGFPIAIDGVRLRAQISNNYLGGFEGYNLVFRLIKAIPPQLSTLKFNKRTLDGLEAAANSHNGLFLVVGPTGSGKSTTLAALIRYINEKYNKTIVTIEDPIEYEHTPAKCNIVQKELGRDIYVLEEGLRSAMREDPDVILIGEIRDSDTLNTALKAAETGHLVFATLHTNDAVSTIQRIVAMSTDSSTRLRLSSSLIGIISQQLKPDINGKKIAIWEILYKNHAVASQIKEGQDTQIKSMIDNIPMSQSMNKTIFQYYKGGRITREMAIEYSFDKENLDLDTLGDILEDQKIQGCTYSNDKVSNNNEQQINNQNNDKKLEEEKPKEESSGGFFNFHKKKLVID